MPIPIIGASAILPDWLLTIVIKCGKCGAHFVMAGQPSEHFTRPCPTCNELHRLDHLPTLGPDGQYYWRIKTKPA